MAIIVCPLSRVHEVVAERRPSHLISLLDPDSAFPAAGLGDDRHLRIGVHDIVDVQDGLIHPDTDHMEDILDFVSRWPREEPILIHCYAGISRSAATAFITACVHNPEADEEEIALSLRGASPNANPNRRLVALADALLERGGRMSRALEAIGAPLKRWPDITENVPFEIASRIVAK